MASSSPALRKGRGFNDLPPEMRGRILHLALGGRILHMAISPTLEAACYIGEKDNECGGVCKCIDPFTRDIRPSRNQYIDKWASYRTRHQSCFSEEPMTARPTVSLLSVSRSVCEEASAILYGANEFHFLHFEDLRLFLTTRHRDQLKLLRHVTLRLSTFMLGECKLEDIEPYLDNKSHRARLLTSVSKLSGLKTLRILWEVDGGDEYRFPAPAHDDKVDGDDGDNDRPFFPDLETAHLLGEISDSVPGRKTAHVYPAEDRLPGWSINDQRPCLYDEDRFWQLERVAVGASGYVSEEDGHEE